MGARPIRKQSPFKIKSQNITHTTEWPPDTYFTRAVRRGGGRGSKSYTRNHVIEKEPPLWRAYVGGQTPSEETRGLRENFKKEQE